MVNFVTKIFKTLQAEVVIEAVATMVEETEVEEAVVVEVGAEE